LPAVTVKLHVVSLAEWLVCHGSHDSADRLFQRWLAADPARRPDFDEGRSLGLRGERPGVSMSRWVTVGWSSSVLGQA